MIRVGCIHIIVLVAIIAQNAKGLEAKQGCGFVAKGTIGGTMGAQKRETAALVELRNIFNNP